ncbi:hypothetical protein OKA05_06910 [Luteolibacter arcticus]|uniref:Uncharacterized protein n=1 Tax=Luteolibacter arcticus TaxID=1581411 RepID=A0ABT3GF86_9BACT|nr:hypothetical protein [Luteolibacter arcticus]MCW1922277.1 hypothetical protein [Luteolibacter arcticus]
MNPILSAITPLPVDRLCETSEEIWNALLKRSVRRDVDIFWKHEELFDQALAHRFGEPGRETEWCVLTISRGIDAFLITVSAKHLNEDFVLLLRDLLTATLPEEPVYLGVYESDVMDYYGHIATLAVFRNQLWVWTRDSGESGA